VRIKFDSKGGFNNALKWMGNKVNVPSSQIRQIADYGVSQLSQGTPKDTGETSEGWKYDIIKTPNGVEIDWKNVAHPEAEVNVAKLIELGHGTGTGGYVPPRPYIKQSMAPVWGKLDKDVEELMK
jgi:hypothetical protein